MPTAPPATRVRDPGVRFIPVTGTVTVTVAVAVNPPSTVRAVIIVVPPDKGLKTPFVTLAMDGLELVQVTALLEALAGEMVAVSVPVAPPTDRINVVGDNVIPVTGMPITFKIVGSV